MKKFLLTIFLVLAFSISPSSVSAQDVTQEFIEFLYSLPKQGQHLRRVPDIPPQTVNNERRGDDSLAIGIISGNLSFGGKYTIGWKDGVIDTIVAKVDTSQIHFQPLKSHK